MPSTLTLQAVEQSTFAITATFYDDDGSLVAPQTLKWSLITTNAAYVNSRQDVAVSSPGSSVTIVLQGDDLAILAGADVEVRYVIFEGTYNSSLGTDLPLNDSVKFEVVNLRKVT